ncbi:hypothetical protein HXX76_014999 [Chlamydomonas incerta]|uniref:Endonuclease/exonuclease/phosphatase domain-containing protein n=1 Tax=Chlamydomonas incerta TaxID=51695 RepID=A0A835VSG7_CHLIN|nr:hypothetical protein HXX76_014999 [Chlamydomonas incerta]|eukprot:KAG2423839.1 hypothetical protein HXX76_014999 [Chlamydomonas incerta]
MAVYLVSVRLPTGEGVYHGVTLEPYVLVKRGEATLNAEDIPEEGAPEGQFQLRARWYRSTLPRGGAVCSVHPDKEASLQCVVCTKCRVATHLSYHCSVECLKSHWHLHREYHKQPPANGGTLENGVDASKTAHGTSTSGLESWIEVGRTRAYTPTSDDVGYVLKFEVTVIDKLHPYAADLGRTHTQSVCTARVRPAPNPPVRSMVQMVPPSQQSNAGRFTILTYNLLADLYAKADFSNTCPPWCLHWHYRKRNLLRELLAHKADILCLQEVQSDHYVDFWAPELQRAGYVAIYKKKTTEIYTDNKYAIDGCATFFRRDRFSLVKKYEVEFNKAALSLAEGMTNPQQKKAALNRLLKDNVALIAVLEAIEPGTPDAGNRRTLICVANTHIHANPELNDVKIWQVHTLLKGLEKIAASADIPMLVAGDFNSVPGSPAHCLLVKGKIDSNMMDSANDPLHLLKDQKMSHSLPLSSAVANLHDAPLSADGRLYKQRQRLDAKHHEPLFTNLTKDFKGTLDYIFYTTTSLQPTAILELPTEADVATRPDDLTNLSLPNQQYSSDHLAIMAEFQYKTRE